MSLPALRKSKRKTADGVEEEIKKDEETPVGVAAADADADKKKVEDEKAGAEDAALPAAKKARKDAEGEEKTDNDAVATAAGAKVTASEGVDEKPAVAEAPKLPTGAAAATLTNKTTALKQELPKIPDIYKEAEEYEEQDDGAEIPEDSDEVWNQHLFNLLLYKNQYKTLHVQATYDPSLHVWVDTQRKLYRRQKKNPESVSQTTQRRIMALEAINFPFTLRGAAHWERYFAKLQEFRKKHGHCLVPRLCEFAGLGDWVIDQRRQYKLMMQGKPSVLDPERQSKLEDLGFVWIVRNRPEWNNRYQELLQYREKHGDTKVPQHYKEIPGLGKWVAKQREQFRLLSQGKHSFLTPDRLEKLNDAGFVWSVRKDEPDSPGEKDNKKKASLKEEGNDEKEESKEAATKEEKKEEEAKADDKEEDGVAKEGKTELEARATEVVKI